MDEKGILDLVGKGIELPTIPMVVARVLEVVNNPNASAGQLEGALRDDSGLVSRILRMANSAYYQRVREAKSVKDAITILGFRTVTNLVLASSTRSLYSPFGLHENMLWEHSVGTAITAAHLAGQFRVLRPDEALVAGLLHDIGKVILNLAKPEEYRQVAESVYNHGRTYYESEREILGFTHCDVGTSLVKKWNFPIEFGKTIYYHHRMKELDAQRMDPVHVKFIALVDASNQMMHRLGIGYRAPREDTDLSALPFWRLVGVEPEPARIDSLLADVEAAYQEEKSKYD
jgi:putative nucleotidyltransferase with HDIG domain